MIAGFLTRIAGPKVLLGVIIAATLAITFLVSQWQNAIEAKANAEDTANTYLTALSRSERELERERDQRLALAAAIQERRARERAARERAAKAEAELKKLESDNEEVSRWSDTPVPRDLRDWLHDDA